MKKNQAYLPSFKIIENQTGPITGISRPAGPPESGPAKRVLSLRQSSFLAILGFPFLLCILFFSAPSGLSAISLTRIGVPDKPVAVDYSPELGKLILSVNYGTELNNFATLATDGTSSQFSPASGFINEVKIAVVRTTAAGFTAGDLFCQGAAAGEIARVSADGTVVQSKWAILRDSNGVLETGLARGGLWVDRTGVWGYNLIVVTTAGGVWKVDSNGNPTLIARVLKSGDPVALEGVITIPNDSGTYGDWAGKILTGVDENNPIHHPDPDVWAIASNGSFTHYALINPETLNPIYPEDIDIAVSGEDFYVVNFEETTCEQGLYHATASQFSPYVNKVILTEEGGGTVYSINISGISPSTFSPTPIASGFHAEHACFAPLAVSPTLQPSISIRATDPLATEGNSSDPGKFTLTRTGDITQDLNVSLQFGGTAIFSGSGQDYDLTDPDSNPITSNPATITMPCGKSTVILTLTARSDATEGNETAVVTVASGTGYSVGNPYGATVNIAETSGNNVVAITSLPPNADPIASEGSTPNNGSFLISRAGYLAAALTVNFTPSGSATFSTDYVLKDLGGNSISTSISIPGGQSSVLIRLEPVNDAVTESSETATLTLTSGGYTTGANDNATVTIYDPPSVSVTADPATAYEAGTGWGQFKFQRTGDLSQPLDVFFELPPGTGRADLDLDYTLNPADPTSIRFNSGAGTVILTVLPLLDTHNEGNETVLLNLLLDPNDSASYSIVSGSGSATVTIMDDVATIPSDLTFSMTLVLDLTGYDSYAYGISGDPTRVIAGQISDHSNPLLGYYWFNGINYGTLTFNGNRALPYGAGSSSPVLVGGVNTTSSSFPYAFKWTSAGGFVQLSGLGGLQTAATDHMIDDSGTEIIVGWSTLSSGSGNGYNRAVSWVKSGSSFGTVNNLGKLSVSETRNSYAYAVNKNGIVVGKSAIESPSNISHGFRTAPLLPINPNTDDIGTMNNGSGSSSANDINDLDEVAGTATVSGGQSHAFYLAPGNQGFTDLGVLSGATSSAGNGINNSGHIVGTSGGKAVIWFSNGTTKDLSVFQSGVAGNVSNLNGWTLTTADKINDKGYIIGSGTKNGVIRAVILVPNKTY